MVADVHVVVPEGDGMLADHAGRLPVIRTASTRLALDSSRGNAAVADRNRGASIRSAAAFLRKTAASLRKTAASLHVGGDKVLDGPVGGPVVEVELRPF